METIIKLTGNDLLRLGISILCGAALGYERQIKNKTAGFRTIILISMGAAIFTMIAQKAGLGVNINIITGIGFIGAGVIFKDGFNISGLTTAAVIWISAAIGMAAGAGSISLAIIATVCTLAVLLIFHYVEEYMDKLSHEMLLTVVFSNTDIRNVDLLEQIVAEHHLELKVKQISKANESLIAAVRVTGHRKRIRQLDRHLLTVPEIKAF